MRKKKLSVHDSIPYARVYAGGIIETVPGVFTRAYRISDIEFTLAGEDRQYEMADAYEALLNTIPANGSLQIVLFHRPVDRCACLRERELPPAHDGLDKWRQRLNELLEERLENGSGSFRCERYFILAVEEAHTETAMRTLKAYDATLAEALRRMSAEAEVKALGTQDRLQLLFDIYHQDGSGSFFNARSGDGTPVFDPALFLSQGKDTKDAVAPSGMLFEAGCFRLGGSFGRSMALDAFPARLSTDFLAEVSRVDASFLFSLLIRPLGRTKSLRSVKNYDLALSGQIADAQKKAFENGISADYAAAEAVNRHGSARELMDSILSRDQQLFKTTVTLTVFAKDAGELDAVTRRLQDISSGFLAPVKTLYFQQEAGLNASLPLAGATLAVHTRLTNESLCGLMPFSYKDIEDPDGIIYGLHAESGRLVSRNRLLGQNFNGLILGQSGSGKTMAAQLEMLAVRLRDENACIYAIDPNSDYPRITTALKGQVIELSPRSRSFINPLDMAFDAQEQNPLQSKSEYLVSLIEIMLGEGRTLTPSQRAVIDRCAASVYRGYIEHVRSLQEKDGNVTGDRDAAPTLAALYRELDAQKEPEAAELARVVSLYATGSFRNFAYRTNIQTDACFIDYDISGLGSGQKELGLHICLCDIYQRMLENRKKGRFTYIYIDELERLLNLPASSRFLADLWHTARKYRGVMTGIIHEPEKLMDSPAAFELFSNSDLILMFKMNALSRASLKQLLGVPDELLRYLVSPSSGNGLLYDGRSVVPFINPVRRDSKLYGLVNSSAGRTRSEKDAEG